MSKDMKESVLKKDFYDKLPSDKIELNWNKKPIEMALFLSFLTVDVVRSTDHLGYSTGWTLLENKELKLRVGGANYGGKEWLNRLEYGEKLSNPYNNYVNPFYLFEILTEEGQQFFVDYYKDNIEKIISDAKYKVLSLEARLSYSQKLHARLLLEYAQLTGAVAIDKEAIGKTGDQPTR